MRTLELLKSTFVFLGVVCFAGNSFAETREDFFKAHGWPNPDRPLWVVFADSHGYNDTFREALQQAIDMRNSISAHYNLKTPMKIKVLHIGDLSDGDNLAAIEESIRVPREFGIPYEDQYQVAGNSEYRGYAVFDRVAERKWRETAFERMLPHAQLLQGAKGPLADDELGYIELWPGVEIGVSHKPLHPLSEKIFPKKEWWRLGNARNWIGVPVGLLGGYIPGVVGNLTVLPSLIPISGNPERMWPDIWMRRKTGKWFQRDDRKLIQRIHERFTRLPRIDPETLFTIRRNTPVKATVDAVIHAHTHIGHGSLTSIPNEYGELQVRSHFGVAPTFIDSTVKDAATGWMSFVELNGKAYGLMMDAENDGEIAHAQILDPSGNPEVIRAFEERGIDPSFSGAIPAGPFYCHRLMGELSRTTSIFNRNRDKKFKRMGIMLGAPTPAIAH